MFGTQARMGVLLTGEFRYSSAMSAPETREDMVSVIQAISPVQVLQKVRSTVAVDAFRQQRSIVDALEALAPPQARE